MHFIGLVSKNLLRRKLRSALTTVGVALAVASVIALVGFSSGLERSMTEVYERRSIDLVVVRAGITQRLTSNLDERVGDRLRALHGVKDVNPSQTDMVSMGEGSLVGIPVQGWPLDGFAMQGLVISRGERLKPGKPPGVLLGENLASTLGKDVGDTVEIEQQPFRIAGIFAGMNVYENMSAVVSLPELQDLMDREGQVTEYQVILDPAVATKPEEVARLSREIDQLRDEHGKRYGLAARPVNEYIGRSAEMGLARGMAWGTSAIALLVGLLGLLNTMMMSVLERTQEFGILKALGWQAPRIVGMVLLEALLISLVGSTFGTGIGWLATRAIADAGWLAGLLDPTFSPQLVAVSVALAIVMGMLASLVPSLRAARLSPVEALHYE